MPPAAVFKKADDPELYNTLATELMTYRLRSVWPGKRVAGFDPKDFNEERNDGLSTGVLTKSNLGSSMGWLAALNERIERQICEEIAAGRESEDPVAELEYVEAAMKCVQNNIREAQRKTQKPPEKFRELSGRHLRISTRVVLREAKKPKCRLTPAAEEYLKRVEDGWDSEEEDVVFWDLHKNSEEPAPKPVETPAAHVVTPAVDVVAPAAAVEVPAGDVVTPAVDVVESAVDDVSAWAKQVRTLRRMLQLRKGEPLPEPVKKRAKLPMDVEDRIK